MRAERDARGRWTGHCLLAERVDGYPSNQEREQKKLRVDEEIRASQMDYGGSNRE